MINKKIALAVLISLALAGNAFATNNNGNNNGPQNATANADAYVNNVNAANSTINDLSNTEATAFGGNGYGGTSYSTANGGQGGQGGAGGQGGHSNNDIRNTAINTLGQSQTGVVTGINGQTQSIDNSGNSVATGGDASNKGNKQDTTISIGGDTFNEAAQPDDLIVRAAPSVSGPPVYPTAPCTVGRSFSLSTIFNVTPIGATYGGNKIDISCQHLEVAKATYQIAGPEAGTKVLCLSEMVQLANPEMCAGLPVAISMGDKERKAVNNKKAGK